MEGVIKILKKSNGYGYIVPDKISQYEGKDIFFHCSDVVDDVYYELKVGDRVEFQEVIRNSRGFQCLGVKKIG